MSNCVVRFGGSSLSKFPVLEAFASLLSKSGNDETIVISAVPEIQQVIEQGIELLASNAATSESIIEQIHQHVIERLKLFGQSEANENLRQEFKSLQNLLKGIEFTGDFSLSLKDQVISYSERITASILQLFLTSKQISSTIAFPEDIGLKVTKEYGNATILYDESADLRNKLPKGINLIPGSYGVTLNGKIARLGKRSADYRDWETDRKSTRLNSSHSGESRMPSSA